MVVCRFLTLFVWLFQLLFSALNAVPVIGITWQCHTSQNYQRNTQSTALRIEECCTEKTGKQTHKNTRQPDCFLQMSIYGDRFVPFANTGGRDVVFWLQRCQSFRKALFQHLMTFTLQKPFRLVLQFSFFLKFHLMNSWWLQVYFRQGDVYHLRRVFGFLCLGDGYDEGRFIGVMLDDVIIHFHHYPGTEQHRVHNHKILTMLSIRASHPKN